MVAMRHVLSQGPMLRSLGTTALRALWQRLRPAGSLPVCPGPWLEAEVAAPPASLMHDFVAALGGDPARTRGTVPAHLFPHWGLPLAARALAGAPFPMLRVMNAGCSVQQNAPLPAGERLQIRARLESIDQNETRALLGTRIVTGTRSAPDALEVLLQAFVPLARPKRDAKRAPSTVPAEAREVARVSLARNAGLEFATLTGDFNPIHWVGPYARAAGFRGAILHGFGTFAHAFEAVARQVGGADSIQRLEARFTRPLVLPASVGVYVSDADVKRIFVGDAALTEPYLVGSYEAR